MSEISLGKVYFSLNYDNPFYRDAAAQLLNSVNGFYKARNFPKNKTKQKKGLFSK